MYFEFLDIFKGPLPLASFISYISTEGAQNLEQVAQILKINAFLINNFLGAAVLLHVLVWLFTCYKYHSPEPPPFVHYEVTQSHRFFNFSFFRLLIVNI